MENREVSSPGAEFTPPGPEFARTGREFVPPGREFALPGPEVHCTQAQAGERKRRRTPLTLAVAVVAAGAVVLSGTFAPARQALPYPACAIPAQHQAYLDQVWQALEEADPEALGALAGDPLLPDLVEHYIKPYAHQMLDDYGVGSASETYLLNQQILTCDLGGAYDTFYDGEALAVTDDFLFSREAGLKVQYHQVTWPAEVTGREETYATVSFVAEPPIPSTAAGESFPYQAYRREQRTGEEAATYESVIWYDTVKQSFSVEGISFEAAVSGTFLEQHREGGSLPYYRATRLQGSYCTELQEDGTGYMTYLENGTAMLTYDDARGAYQIELVVRDGQALLNDQVCLTRSDDGAYSLWGLGPDGSPIRELASGQADPEDNVLYHLFSLPYY